MFLINLKYGRVGQYNDINNEMIEICLPRFSHAISTMSPGNYAYKILTRNCSQSFVSDKFFSSSYTHVGRREVVRVDCG